MVSKNFDFKINFVLTSSKSKNLDIDFRLNETKGINKECEMSVKGLLNGIVVESPKSHAIPSSKTNLSLEIKLLFQFYHCCCDESLPDLNKIHYRSGKQITPLRDRDRLRNDPQWVPCFWAVVPGCSGSSYGASPNLWVQKKFIKFRQSARNAWLRLAEFFGNSFSDSPFNFFRILGDVLLSHSWIKCVLCLTVPLHCIFRCSSPNCR